MSNDRWEGRRQRMTQHGGGSAAAGFILVGIGVVFLLVNLGFVRGGQIRLIFREFWPLILIFVGVKMLVFDRGTRYSYSPNGVGVFWILVGAFFLLPNIPGLNTGFRVIWPFLPLAIGAFILFKVFIDKDRDAGGGGGPDSTPPDTNTDSDSNSNATISANVSLGHVSRRSNSQEFRGGSLSTFLGMCEVDLRGASPAGGEAIMNVSTFLGGIEIRVPTDWTVVNRVSTFLGAVEDQTHPPKDESKRLILRGSSVLGGVEVKH